MDTLVLLLALRMAGHAIRPLRVLAGAAAGVGLARLCPLLPWPAESPLVWLPTAALMMRIADVQVLVHPIKSGAALLAAACLLGGTVHALGGAMGLPAAWPVGAALCLAAAIWGCRRGRTGRVRLRIAAGGGEAVFDAIVDTGNCLHDYLTGMPVIVLPLADARERLDVGALRLRPIAAQTAGGRQMMLCFVPDGMQVTTGGKARRVLAAAALSPGLEPGSPALIPGVFMDEF